MSDGSEEWVTRSAQFVAVVADLVRYVQDSDSMDH